MKNSIITIRQYHEADTLQLTHAVQESIENLSPFFDWAHKHYMIKDARDWVLSRQDAWEKGEEYSFLITAEHDNSILGGVGINALNRQHGCANLGYWVRKSALRQNVAVTAAKLAAAFGFKELGLNRIEIIIMQNNIASQRVAEKLAAKKEGILRKRLWLHGKSHDAILYSLIIEDLCN